MAKTYGFGTQNQNLREPDKFELLNFKLGVLENYSFKVDEPGNCEIVNKTSPIDQPEMISYQYQELGGISTRNKIANPLPDKSGIMYGVRVDAILRGTSDTDDTFVQDLPIVCNLTFRHPAHAAVTDASVKTVLMRTLSALYKDNGECRIKDLMRNSVRPTAD